jgi:hypothetical protein
LEYEVAQMIEMKLVKPVLRDRLKAIWAKYIGVVEALEIGEETTKLMREMVRKARIAPPENNTENNDDDNDDDDNDGDGDSGQR